MLGSIFRLRTSFTGEVQKRIIDVVSPRLHRSEVFEMLVFFQTEMRKRKF